MPEEPVVVGHIARAIGVKGEVKAIIEADDKNRLNNLKKIIINIESECFELIPKTIKPRSNYIQINFLGIDSPENASLLSGAEIIIPKAERPSLNDYEFYVDDLIGCMAETEDGEEIGTLIEVWHQPHYDLWVIDGANGDILIPAVKDFISKVDLIKHKIIIKYIEGLWD